jgi:hypothetical protein
MNRRNILVAVRLAFSLLTLAALSAQLVVHSSERFQRSQLLRLLLRICPTSLQLNPQIAGKWFSLTVTLIVGYPACGTGCQRP